MKQFVYDLLKLYYIVARKPKIDMYGFLMFLRWLCQLLYQTFDQGRFDRCRIEIADY